MGAWYRAYCENCGDVGGLVFRKAKESLGVLPICQKCHRWNYEWEMTSCPEGAILIWDHTKGEEIEYARPGDD
jgi:hypothetical protein